MYFLTIDCSLGRICTDVIFSNIDLCKDYFLSVQKQYPDACGIVTETLDDGCDHVTYVWEGVENAIS